MTLRDIDGPLRSQRCNPILGVSIGTTRRRVSSQIAPRWSGLSMAFDGTLKADRNCGCRLGASQMIDKKRSRDRYRNEWSSHPKWGAEGKPAVINNKKPITEP
ncbi:hypothetical protein Pla52o_37310 [Novipirellula galeiformis]|uniref:Uncharacterized protein n=1 Tax=Novipirellula galeiformis TaxID=2528004 RepID=A0A5C6CDJ1_9BACT|nr:hypothetical protein [Novipirellula galeiformis]TWU21544.1 hypothetical protein Pla52o_37310 [Novipirellula galeiformis]